LRAAILLEEPKDGKTCTKKKREGKARDLFQFISLVNVATENL
jgi:hypothetical protein